MGKDDKPKGPAAKLAAQIKRDGGVEATKAKLKPVLKAQSDRNASKGKPDRK